MLNQLKTGCALSLLTLLTTNTWAHELSPKSDSYLLHQMLIFSCLIIMMIIFGVLFYALIRHAQSKTEGMIKTAVSLEILWTLIPLVILLGLAIPAIKPFFNPIYKDKAPIQTLQKTTNPSN